MNEREAQDIIRMVEANWHFDLGPARQMWRDELVLHDAELATKSVGHLAKRMQYKITLSDLVQTLTMIERNARADDQTAQDSRAIEGKRGYATPEWVWVWMWCRNYREPQDWRTLPQQEGIPELSMTTEDYGILKEEWVAAGSPKDKITASLVKSL